MKANHRIFRALPCLLGLAAMSGDVLAATGSDELTVKATLGQAMVLSCDQALDFGRVGLFAGDRGGTNTIDMPVDGSSPTVAGAGLGVTVVTNGSPGSCTLTGSSATEGTALGVSFSTPSIDVTGSSAGGPASSPSGNASAPNVSSFTTNNPTVDAQGGATVTIGGTLTLSNNYIADNFGVYDNTVTVTVDDAI